MGTYSKHIIEVETIFKKRGDKTISETTKTVEKLGRGVTKTIEATTKLNNKNKAITTTTERLNKGFERFQMEQLGVMFAGMALNRAMAGLNSTAREWLGIGDLMSTMFGITFLDANMDLLEFGVLPLFDALTNLPEGAKKAIGYVSFALEGLGGVMMTGGQLMLGLSSTATMLEKIGGDSVITGLNKVKDKLILLGRFAAIGVTLYMATKDISEGEITAAIGDLMMASGFIWKNGWLIAAGIALKVTGDADTQKSVAKIMIGIADQVLVLGEWISDTLGKALTLRWEEIDTTFFSNFMDVYREAGEELNQEGKLHSELAQGAFMGMGQSAENYATKLDAITKKYAEDSPEWTDAVEELEDEYSILIDFIDTAINSTTELNRAYKNADLTLSGLMENTFGGPTVENAGQVITPKAVGGKVRNTGRYFLHEGEEVIPKSGTNEGVVINATYNVNVSDKREFERMLKQNNDQLTADIRRIAIP